MIQPHLDTLPEGHFHSYTYSFLKKNFVHKIKFYKSRIFCL